MTAAVGRICAVGLAIVLASGCASDYLKLVFSQNIAGPDQVIAGSVESVTGSTLATLSRLGLSGVATREGEGMRITATSPRGTKFALLLTRVKGLDDGTQATEQTRVWIEWEDTADKELGLQVLAQLVVSSAR